MIYVAVAFVFFVIGVFAASLLAAAKNYDLTEENIDLEEENDQLIKQVATLLDLHDAGRPQRDPVTGRFAKAS